jgi:2,4-dienoyl-CoA reductase-like NADH-dependent reductase (Old Yellow Enzyme family)
MWNRALFAAAKQRVTTIPVFAVGGIRTAAEVHAILDAGEADMVGIGRPFYAEPDVARRILGAASDGDAVDHGLCVNSNKCVPAQMLGMKGACYNPDVIKKRARS